MKWTLTGCRCGLPMRLPSCTRSVLWSGGKTPRCLQYTSYPNSHLQGINVRQALQRLKDVALHGAVLHECLRAVFSELNRLNLVVYRRAWAREARNSVDGFVDTRVRLVGSELLPALPLPGGMEALNHVAPDGCS